MRPISITKKQTSGGIFLLIMFFAVLFFILLTYPKYNDWQEKQQEIEIAQSQLQKIKTDSNTAMQSIANIGTPDFDNVDMAIPADPSLGDLYAHIEKLAASSAVNLNSVQALANSTGASQASLSPSVDNATALIPTIPMPNGLNTISLDIAVSGSYNNVQQFLKSLYSSLRIINIQSLGLNGAGGSASNGAVSAGASTDQTVIGAKIEALTYYSIKQ